MEKFNTIVISNNVTVVIHKITGYTMFKASLLCVSDRMSAFPYYLILVICTFNGKAMKDVIELDTLDAYDVTQILENVNAQLMNVRL